MELAGEIYSAIYLAVIMMKKLFVPLLVLFQSITVLIIISTCNKYNFRPENLYGGYMALNPPFDENAQNAINIAIIQILKSEFDTASLNMKLMEDDSTYLVDFDPKQPPVKIDENGDTTWTLVCDGNTTVIISKYDFIVLKHYGPFRELPIFDGSLK